MNIYFLKIIHYTKDCNCCEILYFHSYQYYLKTLSSTPEVSVCLQLLIGAVYELINRTNQIES